MAEYRQLTHPPLREALIDLRISEELPNSFVQKVADQRIPGCDTMTKMFRAALSFQISKGAAPEVAKGAGEHFGWRFDAKDGSRVAQLRRDGMTYSILRDYTKWDDLKSSARRIWDLYREWGSPRLVNRVAVRYINVLNLSPGTDTDAYLVAGPKIPVGLPQAFSSFLNRVVIPFAPEQATVIVTQALELPLEATIPIVLDIDAFCAGTFAPESEEVWARLEKLRGIKNKVFFASVTERALETYQ